MLILTRRTGEAILIDGGVRIVVLETDGNGVRLGIEAPPSVGILREEVVERIAEENIRAGATEEARQWFSSLGGSDAEDSGTPSDTEEPEGPSESQEDGEGKTS